MSKNNLFIISKSDRPLGMYRMTEELRMPERVPTVPLECVQERFVRLIGENTIYHKESMRGPILGYVQDARAAHDIIDHSMFLYVETSLKFNDFLDAYAVVPYWCPVCLDEINFLNHEERLDHIIRCRWSRSKDIILTTVAEIEMPSYLH